MTSGFELRVIFMEPYQMNKKILKILIIMALVAATGIVIASIATYSLSLNSPTSFPVDI